MGLSLLLDLPMQILSQVRLELRTIFFIPIRLDAIEIHFLHVESFDASDRVSFDEFLVVLGIFVVFRLTIINAKVCIKQNLPKRLLLVTFFRQHGDAAAPVG